MSINQKGDIYIWGLPNHPGFEELQNELSSESGLSRSPKATLYHYTDAAGVEGIIKEEKELRLTDIAYMNDAGELKYAVQLVMNMLESRKRSEPDLYGFFDRLQARCNPFQRHFGVYVTCFCERGDLLSQWRIYGRYAIGFQVQNEIRVEHHPVSMCGWEAAFFRKVEYDKEEQERMIARVIDRVVDLYKRYPPAERPRNEDFGLLFSNLITEYLLAFKDPAFHEEKEWRMIHYELLREAQLDFRPKRDYLIPYVTMPIRAVDDQAYEAHVKNLEEKNGFVSCEERSEYVKNNGRFPVGEINIGPIEESNLAERSLKLFLQKHGLFYDVKVNAVTTPLRSYW